MAESEPPATPEPIKWLRWLWHHLVVEGDMIRRAPLAAIIFVVLAFFAAKWASDQQYEGKVSGLDGVVSTKEAEIDFLDKRLSEYEERPGNGATITSRANLKAALIGRIKVPNSNVYAWNVAYQNTGTGAATAIIHSGDEKIVSKSLSAADLDKWFDDLHQHLRSLEQTPPTSEVQPGDMQFFTIVSNIDGKDIDSQVVAGPKILYTVAVIEYRDTDTPPGKWRVTEMCGFTNGSTAEGACDQHNRIYLSD